ncbi:hypothetical protein DYB37_005284 [Aphanomyces astaci]|uniref:Ankyrin repeat domain-containing protein 54 n=1 Tax=Aphanomyces astaci TaxID=112090 RepID=A0A3R6WRE8_APHAT|nr:hypothetical protein DYB35_004915 [Aphanomyces astaci]RHZ16822.1 hypothetical protein DYB37_005284 [Aphanomyces astaci]
MLGICACTRNDTCNDVIEHPIGTSSSPLHHNRCDGKDILSTKGHDINARNLNGATPLHVAALADEGEAVMSLLVSNGANVNAINSTGSTPLHVCARLNRVHGAAILLTQGDANIHAVTAEVGLPICEVFHCLL